MLNCGGITVTITGLTLENSEPRRSAGIANAGSLTRQIAIISNTAGMGWHCQHRHPHAGSTASTIGLNDGGDVNLPGDLTVVDSLVTVTGVVGNGGVAQCGTNLR